MKLILYILEKYYMNTCYARLHVESYLTMSMEPMKRGGGGVSPNEIEMEGIFLFFPRFLALKVLGKSVGGRMQKC